MNVNLNVTMLLINYGYNLLSRIIPFQKQAQIFFFGSNAKVCTGPASVSNIIVRPILDLGNDS